jgi:hypothetical protein
MAAALDPDVVWQGIRPDLVCHGPDEVIAALATAYDANQEIDALELLGGDRHVVLGARARELAIADVDTGGEIYNVFTIDDNKRSRASRTTCSATRRSGPRALQRPVPGGHDETVRQRWCPPCRRRRRQGDRPAPARLNTYEHELRFFAADLSGCPRGRPSSVAGTPPSWRRCGSGG